MAVAQFELHLFGVRSFNGLVGLFEAAVRRVFGIWRQGEVAENFGVRAGDVSPLWFHIDGIF